MIFLMILKWTKCFKEIIWAILHMSAFSDSNSFITVCLGRNYARKGYEGRQSLSFNSPTI